MTRYTDTRKTGPTSGAALTDGGPNDVDRLEIGPPLSSLHEEETAIAAMRHAHEKIQTNKQKLRPSVALRGPASNA